MTAMAGPRKTISVHDYPEHLNPFREEDNHNKIRFWTIGRKLSRSNSITFSGIKDFRNSWSLRSFMKKGKKAEQPSPKDSKTTNHVNGDVSPIVYRRALQYSSASTGARSTVGSPERVDRYVYGGSVTPLPRSRFQERLRSSQQDVNSPSATPRMARSDITGSRLSVESTNPFDDQAPIPPVRASRRKKKRAPPPPQAAPLDGTGKTSAENLELRITEPEDKKTNNANMEDEIEDVSFNIELKIVEDIDDSKTSVAKNNEPDNAIANSQKYSESSERKQETTDIDTNAQNSTHENVKIVNSDTDTHSKIQENEEIKTAGSEDDILNKVSFPKVNIHKYRRNSSVNEDDIKLRRGNLEDFHSLSNKRSQSLTNNLDGNYITYDINLNESRNIDVNSNNEPHKVICKVYEEARKKSVDNSISSTEKDFLEIDRATRELEREISKLNTALIEDDLSLDNRPSVSDIRRKFDVSDANSPNPIPKPRRSHYGESNGNI